MHPNSMRFITRAGRGGGDQGALLSEEVVVPWEQLNQYVAVSSKTSSVLTSSSSVAMMPVLPVVLTAAVNTSLAITSSFCAGKKTRGRCELIVLHLFMVNVLGHR